MDGMVGYGTKRYPADLREVEARDRVPALMARCSGNKHKTNCSRRTSVMTPALINSIIHFHFHFHIISLHDIVVAVQNLGVSNSAFMQTYLQPNL